MKVLALIIVFTFSACSSIRTKEEKEILSDKRVPFSGQKIPVSVTQFKNRSSTSDTVNCRGWFNYPDIGSALSERLTFALGKYEKFDVLERETIRDIYENEVDLINSEKVEQIEKGQFRKAKFTLVGVVTSFEFCAQETAAGAVVHTLTGFGGIAGRSSKAKVQVLLRAIDTRTGKVIASAKGEGDQTRSGFKGFGGPNNAEGGIAFGNKEPLGEAIDLAIGKALKEIETKLAI